MPAAHQPGTGRRYSGRAEHLRQQVARAASLTERVKRYRCRLPGVNPASEAGQHPTSIPVIVRINPKGRAYDQLASRNWSEQEASPIGIAAPRNCSTRARSSDRRDAGDWLFGHVPAEAWGSTRLPPSTPGNQPRPALRGGTVRRISDWLRAYGTGARI